MTGICAGISGKVELGDAVVASLTWDYGSGKRALDEEHSSVFRMAPYQISPSARLLQIALELASNPSLIQEIRGGWSGRVPNSSFSVHVGPMASGASVIADNGASEVLSQHKDLIAVEMEAYAVMSAVEYFDEEKPSAIVIKSVCDFADSTKSNDWQKYAAYTSAAFADKLLRKILND